MKIKNVIHRDNLPRKMPIAGTLLWILALDFWNAPQWVWGAVGVLFLILWSAFFYELVTYDQKEIDIFKGGETLGGAPKPKWQQRFDELKNRKS